jgi:hypothetical protein
MYHDFKIAITTTKNILRIKSQYNFIEEIELTSTLSGIPFTKAFLNNYPEEHPIKFYSKELIDEFYTEFHFLWDYSDIPIILYAISHHPDHGGKGDEAWLFANHKLTMRYFEERANIGIALDKALADSKLDLGKIPGQTYNPIEVPFESTNSFYKLGFKFKKNPEDFFK